MPILRKINDMLKRMTLLHNTPSPFCRKVDVVIEHHGLCGLVDIQNAKTHDVNDPLELENPLGKIPTLLLAKGGAIYDSEVIIEYLDEIGSSEKILPSGADKYLKLTEAKLVAGITDAAVLVVYESRLRPAEKFCQEIVDMQMAKLNKGLCWFVENLPSLQKLNIVNISLAVLLEYLDIRINADVKNGTKLGQNIGQWRDDHTVLVAWLEEFNQLCPYFIKTCPYR